MNVNQETIAPKGIISHLSLKYMSYRYLQGNNNLIRLFGDADKKQIITEYVKTNQKNNNNHTLESETKAQRLLPFLN